MRLVSSSFETSTLSARAPPAVGANLVGYRFAVENIGDDDRRAFFGKLAAVRRADMARATGNDGDFAASLKAALWIDGVLWSEVIVSDVEP